MFDWLEQPPAIYNANHVDYKWHIQLFVEQAVAMGDSLDCATLELRFKSLQMSYNHYKCLAISKNGLQLITNILQKQCEYPSLQILGASF